MGFRFSELLRKADIPRLLDLAMRHREFTRYRERIVPQARGTVLEIGVGAGLNLPFYGNRVERLYALDPSEELLRMAGAKMDTAPFPVELVAQPPETLPLADQSIDTVVTTFCSAGDSLQAIREMRRVLKPNGALLLAEHGLAPEQAVQRWQRRLNPMWCTISGGCNLDREMNALIRTAGFDIKEITAGYAKGPRPLAYVYSGTATPVPAPRLPGESASTAVTVDRPGARRVIKPGVFPKRKYGADRLGSGRWRARREALPASPPTRHS